MRTLFISILVITSILCSNCKTSNFEKEKKWETSQNLEPVDKPAIFEYGNDSIMKIIYSNMKLEDISGTVWATIKIDTTGKIIERKIIKTTDTLLNKEARRLLKLIPTKQWEPAKLGPDNIKIPGLLQFSIEFDEAAKILYGNS